MEFFGFASGPSKTGPEFPYMPESVLSDYPNTLLEHPAIPTAAGGFLNLNNLNFIETPDPRAVLVALQRATKKSLTVLDKQTLQAIGIGLSATVCVYGAWKISQRWGGDLKDQKRRCYNSSTAGYDPMLQDDLDDVDIDVNVLHKQLLETRKKLDELRLDMTHIEGEKEMLEAEVSMRKKMVASLQGELHTESDKRQQAELRMEMMEWENAHLRQMRKDFVAKEGKIDLLEASLKEKDAMHDKLFQENVIIPKNIAAARAKEYESLRTKLQRLEMNASIKRNSGQPYKPSRHISRSSVTDGRSFWDGSSDTLETAEDWENSGITSLLPTNVVSRARMMFNWSNSARRKYDCGASLASEQDQIDSETTTGQHMDKAPKQYYGVKEIRVRSPGIYRPELGGSICGDRESSVMSNTTINTVVEKGDPERTSVKNTNKQEQNCLSEEHVIGNDEQQTGVINQIKSFLSGVSHSTSGCHLGSSPGCPSPAQMGDVLPSESQLWTTTFEDKDNNCCLQSSHKEKEEKQFEEIVANEKHNDYEEDECEESVSEDRNSEFLSASCGSDTSDDDTRTSSSRQRKNRSSNRAKSTKRVRSTRERSYSSRKAVSPVTKQSPAKDVKGSPIKQHRNNSNLRMSKQMSPTSPSPNDTPFSILAMPSSERTSPSKVPGCRTAPSFTLSIPNNIPQSELVQPSIHQGRARFRHHRSHPKMTENGLASDGSKNSKDTLDSLCDNLPSSKCAKELLSRFYDEKNALRPGKDTNKNSAVDATDSESEKSWIVITPAS